MILGAGVMGLLTARALAANGVSVALVDRFEPGCGASWAGGGILSPLRPWVYPDAVSRLVQRSVMLYADLVGALAREVGIDIEMLPSGMLYVNEDPGPAATWAAKWGHACEPLDGASLPTIQVGIAESHNGVWFRGVQQIRNPRLVKALIAWASAVGIPVFANVVPMLHVQGNRVAVALNGERARFEREYVVTAGAWTNEVLRPLGVGIAVRPVRGQMLCIRATPGVLQRIVMQGDHYLIPRRDGRILVGSTLEEVGFDMRTTAAARDELLGAGKGIFPALEHFPIEAQWAGLRPGSPTGVPSIGRHPRFENLWICAGHYRNGLAMAPASAELLCELMLGKRPTVDPGPYVVASG